MRTLECSGYDPLRSLVPIGVRGVRNEAERFRKFVRRSNVEWGIPLATEQIEKVR
jgi:hypothetical protein